MTPSGRVQLILGAFATAAVAFLSYFVVKRRLVRGKDASDLQGGAIRGRGEGDTSAGDEKVSSEVQQELQKQESKHDGGGDGDNGNGDSRTDKLAEEVQGQTSFIVLDNGEELVPPDNGQHPKKSDRSSDESSYDVIDDDDQHLAETGYGEGGEDGERDESGHALADSSVSKQQDTFPDENETSMVIIEDLDRSIQSKSGSSFYASADEATEAVSRFDEIKDEERDKILELSDVPEDTSSITTFPSADLDFSLLSDKDKVEDDPAWEGSSGSRSQVQTPASSGAPLALPEDSPGSSAVGSTDNLTSRLDIVLKPGPNAAQDTTAKENVELEAGAITEILTVCQNSPSTVSKENVRLLVSLLRKKVPELHSTVLNCVLRVAAFTQNVKTLRDSGCLEVVADQIQEACKRVGEGGTEAELLNSLCQVLTNLTLDPKCQAELEETVPALIDLLLSSNSEPVKLSALRPLINFSSQSNFHSYYINAVQSIYDLLETGSHIAKVQSLKILVNLSLNNNMMPHLLAAKAPKNLLELLDAPTPTDLTLRTLTMLANLEVALQKSSDLLASIPEEAKTASPETVYKLLHGADRLSFLRGKVLRLTRHNDEDVSHQASKLLQYIQEKSGGGKQ